MRQCRECGGKGSVLADGVGIYVKCNSCYNSTGYYDSSKEATDAWDRINSGEARAERTRGPSSWEIAIEALEKIAHYDEADANMDDPHCRDGHICADIAREAMGKIRRKGNDD